ncbi:MAG: methyltransferase domain-containing protein [Deltaproteobacteria bacterium]|nr:methyltransferase domain-containing protein [Deltaproteobacteria bacterium]
MAYFINSTRMYHIRDMNSLGWELTVCNSLYPDRSPCRTVLANRVSYGCHLYDFLRSTLPIANISSVLEIGGGYGYLMHDLLKMNPDFQATMIDISPFLLEEQKKILHGYPVQFQLADIFDIPGDSLRKFDLVILNENIGDFPTGVNIAVSSLMERTGGDTDLQRMRSLFRYYAFPLPERDTFNFNLGAVEVTEKLCKEGIPYIFMSEHSCEATVPDEYRDIIPVSAPGNPERIVLKGHDEYTIKFSLLEIVAAHHGYHVRRGPLADFVRADFSDSLLWLLKRRHSTRHEHEVLRHFVADLFQYEYLLLTRQVG